MKGFFYARLALTNLKKNRKTYLPYILACTGTVMMFFIILSLSQNSALTEMAGGAVMAMILLLGAVIVGFFAVLFLFYTNSFLVKRRKKEFGLYYILGMEKRHIGRIMLWETAYTAVISLVCGILLGLLFCKLVFLALLRLLRMNAVMGVEISGMVVAATVILFGVIFLMIFANSVRQVYTVRPVELLKGGQIGEREPKTRWLMALVGVVTLVAGYIMAVTVEDAVTGIMQFFLAVLLVIVATFCLFTAGSIVLLKLLRRKKGFYYKANHFISVSGMIYRMKQNAASLASICVMSTGVILLISSTTSLYVGEEDALLNRYPSEFEVSVDVPEGGEAVMGQIQQVMEHFLKENQVKTENLSYYPQLSFTAVARDGEMQLGFSNMQDVGMNDLRIMNCVCLEDYNRMKGTQKKLAPGEALFYTTQGVYEPDTITFGDLTLKLQKLEDRESFLGGEENVYMTSVFGIIVSDFETLRAIENIQKEGYGERFASSLKYRYSFDVAEMEEQEICALNEMLEKELAAQMGERPMQIVCRAEVRKEFYMLYGGLFFLGIFLGLLFLMATVLIIYYKQISEGYEDKERFVIMKKIGMDKEEIRKAIHSQVLMVFFLPLLTAGIHSCFAFHLMKVILQGGFGLSNVTLFVAGTLITFLVFGAFYILVYFITAREYYKIVSEG